MAPRYPTNPLDDPPDDHLTFSEITLLALLFVGASVLAVVLSLGALCADHRIVGVLNAIL